MLTTSRSTEGIMVLGRIRDRSAVKYSTSKPVYRSKLNIKSRKGNSDSTIK